MNSFEFNGFLYLVAGTGYVPNADSKVGLAVEPEGEARREGFRARGSRGVTTSVSLFTYGKILFHATLAISNFSKESHSMTESAWTAVIAIMVGAAGLAGALASITKYNTPSALLWSGAFLSVEGLAGAFLASQISLDNAHVTPSSISYLINFYLLISGIGGNCIVGAVVVKKLTTTIHARFTGYIMPLDANSPLPPQPTGQIIGELKGEAKES